MDLEQNIRQAVHLPKKAGSGFWPTNCAVCGETQGRGGFKFEVDGTIAYHCFKGACDAAAVYNPNEGLTYKFKRVLKAFNVDIPHELLLNRATKKANSDTKTAIAPLNTDIYTPHHYDAVELPGGFVRYDQTKHGLVYRHLESRYLPHDREYYIGAGRWQDMLIVPCRFHGRLIGWQAEALLPNAYLKFEKNGSDIWFLPEGYFPDEPIIVEGYADALSVPFGIASLQSEITKKQAYFLRDKNPILLPDRFGSKFMKVAKTYGWRVIVPPYPEKDANEALKQYGRLVLAEMIRDNVIKNYNKTELKYQLWSEDKKNNKKNKYRRAPTLNRR